MSVKDSKSPLSFVTSILKFSVATWVNAVLYAAALLFVNLFIDKAIFGVYDLMISASTTLMSVVTLGFDHAYLRFYHEPPKGADDNRQIASAGLRISVFVLLLFSAVFIFLIPDAIGRVFFEGRREIILLVSMCVTTLCMVVNRFFNITYRMQNNVLMFSFVSIALQFFTRIFFVFGVFIKKDFSVIAVFGLCGLVLFTVIFFLIFMKDMLPKKHSMTKEAFTQLLKYSFGLMPSSVLLWGNQLVNKLFISAKLGDSSLGLFAFAALISQSLGILQGGFATFWSAYMFEHYKTENERIRKMHDLMVFVMMVLMCILILLSPVIFIILSGFSDSREIFGLLLYAPLLMIIAETTVYGIEIAKKTVLNSLSSLICIVTNIIFCIVLVPRFDIAGAAGALVLSTAAMFIFRTVMAQRYYRTIKSYFKTFLSLLVMAALSVASYIFSTRYIILMPVTLGVLLLYVLLYKEEVDFFLVLLRNIYSSLKKKA